MSTLPVEYFAYTPQLRIEKNPEDVDPDYVDPYTQNGGHGAQLNAFIALADEQLDLVEKHTRGRDLEETLFVFCGPEFYFKYEQKYPFSNSVLINGIEYIKTKIAAKGLQNVLFIPGTVWWSTPPTKSNAGTATADKPVVINTAIVFYGGGKDRGKLYHTWQKENLSWIDGLQFAHETSYAHKTIGYDGDSSQISEDYQRIAAIQQPCFTLTHGKGGSKRQISVGLEVCLDHGRGRLKDRLKQEASFSEGVDLHIMIAAGMPVEAPSIVAKDGGAYLRCDGHPGCLGSNCYTFSNPYDASATSVRSWTDVEGRPVSGSKKPLLTQFTFNLE